MILRSFTKHVNDQNWFAVFLDFFIVVIGVFVGLQVSNWSQGKEDQRRGRDYVERLSIDMREDIRTRGNLLSYYDAVNASAKRTVELLSSPMPDPQELVVNAYRATEYATDRTTRATWDEVISSGDISLLPQAAVKNGLVSYFTANGAENARQNMLNSTYRKRVRRTIPHKVQRAIRKGCGDVRDDFGGVTGFKTECNLNVSDAELSKAANALLSDPELLPDLWFHFSNVSSARGDLNGNIAQLEYIIHVLEGGPPSTAQKRALSR